MSSPSSVSANNASACIREGTRVILREITANLQNSPPGTSPRRKSGNEASSIKTDQHQQQHDVKVRFIREFADAATLPIVNDGITETNSLSSASSFQSLASTLSSKCSSGICVDSSPHKNADRSYTNADISGLDDLISACENIRLDETITTPSAAINEITNEQSFVLHLDSEDHSPDQTFTSATDQNSPDRDFNVTTNIAIAEDPKIDSQPITIVDQIDITQQITSENLEKQIDRDLNITTNIQTENPPHSEKEININVDIATERETLLSNPENQINLGQDNTTEIKTENLPINPDNLINLDKTAEIKSENSLLNPENPETLDLDKTPEIIQENSPIIPENQINHDLDKTTEIRKENSLINPENQIHLDLDKTTEIKRDNSPINFENQINLDLDKTTEIKRDNSPINFENQINLDLDKTTEIKKDNSPINFENQINLDLDKTTEIKRDNSPINFENQINLDLDKTTEIKRDNSPINFENQINPDLDKTTEIRTENSENPTNLDFDKTTDIRDLSINPGNLINLDTTTEIKSENSPLNFENQTNRDLNTTTEIKRDNSPLNREFDHQELDLTRTIDEETEASLANADLYCKFLNSVKSTPSELESTNEKFVQGNSDIAQLQKTSEKLTSSCVETELAKTEDSTKAFEIPNKEDEEFKRYEDHPLESLTPSYTDYHENLKSPEVDQPRIDETVNSPLKITSIIQNEELKIEKSFINETTDCPSLPSLSSVCFPSGLNETIDLPTLDLPKISSVDEKSFTISAKFSALSDLDSISTIQEPTFLKTQTDHSIETREEEKSKDSTFSLIESSDSLRDRNIIDDKDGDSSDELNSTITLQDTSADDILTAPEADQYAEFVPQKQSTAIVPRKIENSKSTLVAGAGLIAQSVISRPITLPDDYSEFVPQRQSTNLTICGVNLPERIERQTTPFVTICPPKQPQLAITADTSKKSPKSIANIDDRCNFAKLELAANSVANDILNTSLELAEENEHFVSAESELFEDQANFDFLLSKTPRKNPRRDLRAESLYINFDPLVSNTSMLPQSIQNLSPPASEARNGENDTTISKIGTPKRNPAIAAIDRLLFYSPMTANTTPTNANSTITNAVTQNTIDAEEKLKPVEETSAETINMAKELELVRTTVLQLEEQLEKLKIDHEEALEKQTSYKDKINQLQAQLAQEIKNKNEITVVVDEYEISISRLVAERERDRKNLDLEKAKLQEELAETKHHLDNTEAAFNDVHLKYERLKGVVATYRNNEIALKESLEENVEIIKSLENRYEQVKSHATARLEKANLDLDAIRKQNESETVRLNAMLRKAELKSNSLAELVEQKTKENNQLTQILDELIARVGRNKSD